MRREFDRQREEIELMTQLRSVCIHDFKQIIKNYLSTLLYLTLFCILDY